MIRSHYEEVNRVADASHLQGNADATPTDLAVEQAIHSMLGDSPHSASIAVVARQGTVTLDGTVSNAAWLARFKNRITCAIPSVTIDDRLEWVVPDCGIGYA